MIGKVLHSLAGNNNRAMVLFVNLFGIFQRVLIRQKSANPSSAVTIRPKLPKSRMKIMPVGINRQRDVQSFKCHFEMILLGVDMWEALI